MLCTQKTYPFKKEHVDAVIEVIHVGDDLSPKEAMVVRHLIEEYTDCFTLSMNEVHLVPGAVHKIDIPEGKTFNTKVHQHPLTPSQCTYFNTILDPMLEASVVVPIVVDKGKCVSPTTLEQKAHQGRGLTLDELKH